MSTNPFKGFGAINQSPDTAAAAKPKMVSLGNQYQDNIKEVWPNSNQSMLLTLAHYGSPYFMHYTLTKDGGINESVANNGTSLSNVGRDAKYDESGTYLAFAHNTTPYVTIYKRDGMTFTKLSNPSSLPTSTCQGVAWNDNEDGSYLAVVQSGSPYIIIYKRSGDTFTRLSDPATLPTGIGRGVTFSPDGTYLVVTHNITPFVTIYKRSGDTFTKLSNPSSLPTSSGYQPAFSPDGTYLAVVNSSTPSLIIYKRSGDTFTKITNPSTMPVGNGNAVKFSEVITNITAWNGYYYMAVGHSTTPFCTLYLVDPATDTFTNLSLVDNLATIPTGSANAVAFTKDCSVLFIGHDVSPFITQVGLTYRGIGGPSFSIFYYNDLKNPPDNVAGLDVLNAP